MATVYSRSDHFNAGNGRSAMNGSYEWRASHPWKCSYPRVSGCGPGGVEKGGLRAAHVMWWSITLHIPPARGNLPSSVSCHRPVEEKVNEHQRRKKPDPGSKITVQELMHRFGSGWSGPAASARPG
ncbi:hypothetical protein LIA77_08898 [Sarocladium implicatum]|nr:hypothetical protein LIA77_08898 [Sarocladium implicatum]